MQWIAIGLAFPGVFLLLIGFWKNRRGVLVVAGVLLFVAGSLGDLVDRRVDTARQAEAEARAIDDAPASTPAPQPTLVVPAAEPGSAPAPAARAAAAPAPAPAVPPAP
jgi:hypothetical protein